MLIFILSRTDIDERLRFLFSITSWRKKFYTFFFVQEEFLYSSAKKMMKCFFFFFFTLFFRYIRDAEKRDAQYEKKLAPKKVTADLN